jgi:hypothetical protein
MTLHQRRRWFTHGVGGSNIVDHAGPWIVLVIVCAIVAGCSLTPATALQRLVEARRLAADLLVQITKSADAGNRAVMAETDDASEAFVREARDATAAVQKDSAALATILTSLEYSDEGSLLVEFNSAFAEYRALDDTLLGLTVENSNLKAQRLAFGSGQEAAEMFKAAVGALAPLAPAADKWRVAALSAQAVANVREIQVLEAPHIAEADAAAMSRLEAAMATAASAARSEIDTLGGVMPAGSRPRLAAARTALDHFMAIHAEIMTLSRRNSNVRSLALSLGQKRAVTAKCEGILHALQEALAKRELGPSR